MNPVQFVNFVPCRLPERAAFRVDALKDAGVADRRPFVSPTPRHPRTARQYAWLRVLLALVALLQVL
ncbi:hypothetical protein ACIO6T_22100 [Streptomyces sp. NPDC087532]|uniref:hypothetical protein n=1 Tax=unclassified Streptomyces TaxID=2593676 RepID=UPI0033252081